MRTLELGRRFRIGSLEIAIVESFRVQVRAEEGLWLSAAREPVAVLVRGNGGTRVLGVDGRPLPLETLREGLSPDQRREVGLDEGL